MLCQTPDLRRRAVLRTGGALFASALLPRLASAAGARDPRLIVVVLRGALDGLCTVAPVGDPAYASLHGALALSLTGDHPALPLDGFFALHPAMPTFARLFHAGQAAVVHAVASPYRERSHFDGQDVLESGLAGPGPVASGWLNRAIGALPAAGRIAPRSGLAIGASTPLIMRGQAPVVGWVPPLVPDAGQDLASRVLALYQRRDPRLADSLSQGLSIDRLANGMTPGKHGGGPESPQAMRLAAEGAARLLAADDGPRVAALCFDGWDTHANEGGATGRLAQLLGGLDGAFDAFAGGLGPAWDSTAILVVTEFGRTVHINGTVGTDHGTGTVALLAGGAVKGGRVIADWPGLSPAALYDGRDLRPTADVRGIAKALLGDHLGLPRSVLDGVVFPGSATAQALPGLVA